MKLPKIIALSLTVAILGIVIGTYFWLNTLRTSSATYFSYTSEEIQKLKRKALEQGDEDSAGKLMMFYYYHRQEHDPDGSLHEKWKAATDRLKTEKAEPSG